jgi:hypothetical protein
MAFMIIIRHNLFKINLNTEGYRMQFSKQFLSVFNLLINLIEQKLSLIRC